jgi:hypothetical protein
MNLWSAIISKIEHLLVTFLFQIMIIVQVLKYAPAQKTVVIPWSLQLEDKIFLVIVMGSNREEAYANYIHIGHKLHANNPKKSQSAILETRS